MKRAQHYCHLVYPHHSRLQEGGVDRTSKRSKQAGIAAVEFTLLLPLLLFFIAAVGEFGNILIKYNTLSKAVQNGARIAVTEVYGTANPDAIASDLAISNAVIYGSTAPLDSAQPVLDAITITISQDGNSVTVTAEYPYQALLAPLLDNILTSTLTLKASSVMRVAP
ncbi:TadE/TadG family type IV pilus assembly protein [Vibrio sp. PNB23_22_6]